MYFTKKIDHFLEKAGIEVNSNQPHSIHINDRRLYREVLVGGRLGFAESYMKGWWDCEQLDELFCRLIKVGAANHFSSMGARWFHFLSFLRNMQTMELSKRVAVEHYNYGNDFYEVLLGSTMNYTSGDFQGLRHDDLDRAQINNMRRACQLLAPEKNDNILEIGSGWGRLMEMLVCDYNAHATGISISSEQNAWVREQLKGKKNWSVLEIDYREVPRIGAYDHAVSVEMIEAVGPKNLREYFEVVHGALRPGGRFVLQSILDTVPHPKADPFIEKYIFRGGILPSFSQLEKAMKNLFIVDQKYELGRSYDLTLMAWSRNLKLGYTALARDNPDKFTGTVYRMWDYYLNYCAAGFRECIIINQQMLLLRL